MDLKNVYWSMYIGQCILRVINTIIEHVRKHFENNNEVKILLGKIKSYKVTK